MQAILYTRVSTQEQAKGRNGLEGQLQALRGFCEREGITPLLHLEEVASGGTGLSGRPLLAQAFDLARRHKACVLVSKLDRLSREVSLISALMTERVKFYTAEDGLEVDPFMLHLKASFAEKERKVIGERTKAALGVLKARGVALGSLSHADPVATRAKALAGASKANKAQADAFAREVRGVLLPLLDSGLTYAQAAQALNRSGTKTARGGAWHASSVRNVALRNV
jgi:DNA invertase Pin-like site-specific DNA recombinase